MDIAFLTAVPKKPRLKLNLTEAELVVALHYVACSRTPTALNLSASTEKSKGWLLGTENTLL